MSSTASVNRRRLSHSRPREIVSASGWKATMPFRLASGSEANGSGDPPSTLRAPSPDSTSSARSLSTRTQTGPGPWLRRIPASSFTARPSMPALVAAFTGPGRRRKMPCTALGTTTSALKRAFSARLALGSSRAMGLLCPAQPTLCHGAKALSTPSRAGASSGW